MQAGGALVLTADPGEAARRAAGQARAALGGLAPSFAVLFASPHFLASAPALVEAVAGETGGVPLIGCVASAVAGGAREVETEPAVSLWLAADLWWPRSSAGSRWPASSATGSSGRSAGGISCTSSPRPWRCSRARRPGESTGRATLIVADTRPRRIEAAVALFLEGKQR